VVAQRLARNICPACATKYFPSERELRDAELSDKVGRPFRKGAGCPQCHDTGFRGRLGIYEVMEVTPELRRMIHHGAATHDLRDCVRRGGVLTLREEGVRLALAGKTSLDEVLRVTHNEDEGSAKPQAAEEAGGGAKGAGAAVAEAVKGVA
jgi:type II secretory ATPase GspE/PulE/Tfp pilus assembly ATPase PilB-like protein